MSLSANMLHGVLQAVQCQRGRAPIGCPADGARCCHQHQRSVTLVSATRVHLPYLWPGTPTFQVISTMHYVGKGLDLI